MSEKLIEVAGVNKSFAGRRVIDNLCFSVNKGEIVGLLGPNGSGKTTTVRLLNGVISPESGTIRVAGMDPGTGGDEIRKKSGVLTESAGLYRNLSGADNLSFFARLYGVRDAQHRIDELLDTFGLIEHRDKKFGTYSTGMKKRLGIAKALLHSPEILFLDEPTTGLDPEGTRSLIDYISGLNRKYQVTILLCTHLLKQVEHLCHKFVFLGEGRVLEEGTLREIEEKYLGEIDLKVETKLPISGGNYQGFEVVGNESGYLIFRVKDKSEIPGLLKEILAEAPVYSAEITGRDLETLYFKIRSGQHE